MYYFSDLIFHVSALIQKCSYCLDVSVCNALSEWTDMDHLK
jgi:hypothetical protein